jgi:prepilin-type N-terminal cleavage/methylation domain-containing protein
MLRNRQHRRRGYTLMEMVCVLAVIVIIAALTIPTIRALTADSNLDAAADQVRGLAAETRARAMEDGRPWRLGFIANTGTFQLAPEESADAWSAPTEEALEKADLRRDVLPKDVVFGLSHDDIMAHEQRQQAGSTWETMAIFMPDGSARDDATTYFGRPGTAPMRVVLRGLTGTVSIEQFTNGLPGR